MRAAIYTRVSTEEQAVRGLSLAAQESLCRQAAERDGADTITVYTDAGASGGSLERPQLQRLLADLDDIDAVYILRIDRLARVLRDSIDVAQSLTDRGVRLVSVTEGIDCSTIQGRFALHLLASVAEYEREIGRARTLEAIRERADRGLYRGGVPTGYRRPTDDQGETVRGWEIVPDPDYAPVVLRIYRSYARGMSMTAIAQGLNDDEITGAGGSPWRASRVGNILRNPAYIGLVKRGDDWIEGVHEPLISDHLYRSVQRRLSRRGSVHPRSLDHSLSPLLRCGDCGGPIRRHGGGRGRPPRYLCSHRARRPARARHRPVGASQPAVDAVIWAWTRHLLSEELMTAADQSATVQRLDDDRAAQRREIIERLAAIQSRLELNMDAYEADAIELAMLSERNEPLLAEQAELREEIERLDAMIPSPADLRWVDELADGTWEWLRSQGVGRQREVLGRLYDRVELHRCPRSAPYRRRLKFVHRLAEVPDRSVAVPRHYAPAQGRTAVDLTATGL